MATFITLINYTDQGIRNVKDTLKRGQAAKKLAAKHGCEIKALYYTMGPHDAVCRIEAPDDESYVAFALAAGSLGNIRTLSLRAHSEDEMKRILKNL